MRAASRLLQVLLVHLPLLIGQTASSADGSPDRYERLIERKREDQRAIIREHFAGRRGGVFLDVGSAHYRDGSMTFFLERDLGWSGLAVDALEHWGEGYREHRPKTRFFAYIVTDETGAEQPFYRLTGDIGSTALEGRADRITGQFDGIEATEILVPTITLDALLEREGVAALDFLNMDIEGGEPKALAGFSIRRFRPALVCIEALPETRDAILGYMQANGYERIDAYLERDPRNWFFRPARTEVTKETP